MKWKTKCITFVLLNRPIMLIYNKKSVSTDSMITSSGEELTLPLMNAVIYTLARLSFSVLLPAHHHRHSLRPASHF